ncbi:hypothetical protein MRX96_042332 [Rhipicephalus microplus]
MFTSDTRTGADASSNMASNVSAVSGGTQGSNFSETSRKSHSEQMTDKSKDTDFEGRLSQRSSTRTRPQFTVTLRPGTPIMGQGSESKATSFHEGSGVNATVVVRTVLEGESSRGTESWSSTADWYSVILSSVH